MDLQAVSIGKRLVRHTFTLSRGQQAIMIEKHASVVCAKIVGRRLEVVFEEEVAAYASEDVGDPMQPSEGPVAVQRIYYVVFIEPGHYASRTYSPAYRPRIVVSDGVGGYVGLMEVVL